MREDTAGQVHRKLYGKSDKANAIENRNNEFQEGYAMAVRSLGEDASKVIEAEGRLRQEVGDDMGSGFAEWVRGFWAARSQIAAAGITRHRAGREPFP
jgi:hypothetical protein